MVDTAPTVAEFREFFGELEAEVDDKITSAIQTAFEMTAVSRTAILYCAAHVLVVSKENSPDADGGAGEVSSETIGPRKVIYTTTAQDGREVYFSRTGYGRTFLQLERRSVARTMSMRVY